MRIAEFKRIGESYTYNMVGSEEEYGDNDGYIRISEWAEVELVRLPYGEAEKAEINVIDKQIQVVQAAAETKINQLKERKAELLAIGSDS